MPKAPREQWGTRMGFLLAAIGSAVGLGNIWRFPYVAYENGGGAFLVPYLAALLTAGIPLLILEYTIGHKYRASPPVAFRRMAKPAEALGWWQVAICFVVAIYYAVIIAWALRYAVFSIGQQWGADPDGFFNESFLGVAAAPGAPESYNLGTAVPLALVWIAVLVCLGLGVKRGIEVASRIFMPLLILLFGALVVRALFLDGAADGLNAFFTPDWSALGDGSVWVAAYGQIFFSLSVGFGIMITYASYLKRRFDLTGSVMVVAFTNTSFELLAGMGVFAALGFMALQSGVGIEEVVASGIGLAFVAFPQIISTLPVGGDIFGILFFGSLMIAGITSLISIVQVVVAAVQDRTGMGRTNAVVIVGGGTALVSMALYPTDQGLFILDVTDRFINNYCIALAGLVVIVVVAWVLRRLRVLARHSDAISTIPLRGWWVAAIGVITPLVLGWMMFDSLSTEFAAPYEDYPHWFLNAAGWGVAGGALLVGIVAALLLRNKDVGPVEVDSVADGEDRAAVGGGTAPGADAAGSAPEQSAEAPKKKEEG